MLQRKIESVVSRFLIILDFKKMQGNYGIIFNASAMLHECSLTLIFQTFFIYKSKDKDSSRRNSRGVSLGSLTIRFTMEIIKKGQRKG